MCLPEGTSGNRSGRGSVHVGGGSGWVRMDSKCGSQAAQGPANKILKTEQSAAGGFYATGREPKPPPTQCPRSPLSPCL